MGRHRHRFAADLPSAECQERLSSAPTAVGAAAHRAPVDRSRGAPIAGTGQAEQRFRRGRAGQPHGAARSRLATGRTLWRPSQPLARREARYGCQALLNRLPNSPDRG
ncbi:hypothetical protein GCM10022402_40390 [Salinactinospora qingdaonensis]|uniref:Uncharacterized protein n=1 Tax=Salinactinospora qingdaonensis TaxID=702744 RepID=A0ABP7G773_9ACTN